MLPKDKDYVLRIRLQLSEINLESDDKTVKLRQQFFFLKNKEKEKKISKGER